jgi:small conductance mechanosensitive channel
MDETQIEGWIQALVAFGVQVLIIIGIIFGAWIVGGMVRGVVKSRFKKRGFDETLGEFLLGLIKPLFLILGIVLALSVFGVEPTSFAAVLGAAGLAIGLALQGALGHVASGILILVFRPFKVGDFIEAGGTSGSVDEISLFNTVLDTPQNIRVIVPNGVAIGGVIKNYSFHERRRVDISVGTDYGASLSEVRRVLADAAASIPNALTDPEPQIFLAALGGSSIDWQVRVWAESANYWQVFDNGTQIVKDKLDAADIGIPFPQMDVHLDRLEA